MENNNDNGGFFLDAMPDRTDLSISEENNFRSAHDAPAN